MKKILYGFFKVCPKTGKLRGIKQIKGLYWLIFPLIGLLALTWILIRVIPKPSRINYPCVKAAMPFAAGFIGNIVVFIISAIAFFKLRKSIFKYQFIVGALLVTLTIGSTYYLDIASGQAPVYPAIKLEPNLPIGDAKGIFPGRVVWVHHPDATNENCTNSQNYDGVTNDNDDGWFLNKNNDQTVIDKMLSEGLKNLTGKTTDHEAWTSVFTFYNKNKGKGEVGYNTNEKIFIKINATSSWGGNFKTNDLSKVDSRNNRYFNISETSPQIVLSVLRQLVNVVGVPQEKIYIGDPMKHIYKYSYEMVLHKEFPNVHYLDHDYSTLGRERVVPSTTAIITYSDNGEILKTNVWSNNYPGDQPTIKDYLYTIFEEADYMINIPMLKGHKRAGITAFAKNHFGSHTRGDASALHNGLVAPTEMESGIPRSGYGLYRVQVDLMGHDLLGGKNLIYIMDALWSSDHELGTPKKFQMQPFNNDWSSSIFLSLDNVAIESVGYDFLRSEFTAERNEMVEDGASTYIQMDGVDDYLHQAADSANWPQGIVYKPSGTRIGSLGTHEHWNNPLDMQYSRNLGRENGIELIKSQLTSVKDNSSNIVGDFKLYQNYPNPFNPSTSISYKLKKSSNISLSVYDITGKLVDVIIHNEYKPAGTYEVKYNANILSSGIYLIQMEADNFISSVKMILLK